MLSSDFLFISISILSSFKISLFSFLVSTFPSSNSFSLSSILISNKAKKQFKKLDKQQQVLIRAWIIKNLEETDNPIALGKSLKGQLSDY